MKKCFAIFTLLCAVIGLVRAEVVSFPGAEGFGRLASGGRGGRVIHVTTLADGDEPGTLRYACNQTGARTIVFDVDGTIFLNRELRLEGDSVTIAGQSAPGDGICIADYPFLIQADNVIIRYLRFRLGDRQVAHHEGDGLGGSRHRNIIIDHCSVSWSIDECLSILGMTDCTVQWCISFHSLRNSGHRKGPHGYGGNWGGNGISYHHNLMANHTSRTPRLGPNPFTQESERMDMRNNVIFNHGSNGCYGGEGMTVNIIGNYYKTGRQENVNPGRIAGPGIRTVEYCLNKFRIARNYSRATGKRVNPNEIRGGRRGDAKTGCNTVTIAGETFDIDMDRNAITVDGKPVEIAWNTWRPMLHTWGRFYLDGNVCEQWPATEADNWGEGLYKQINPATCDNYWDDDIKEQIRLREPFDCPAPTTHTAREAFELVLAKAGASHRRDAYDAMVVADVRDGGDNFSPTGIIDSQSQIVYADGSCGWPKLASGKAAADTDGDGIPDEWETSHGLNPQNEADGAKITPSGYSNLEIYLNSLVAL